jgi:hypothetical protein
VVLGFALLVLVASCILATYLRARGRKAEGFVGLLICLAVIGATAFGLSALVAGLLLWGFDLGGERTPDWAGYLCPVAGLIGTVCGVGMAFHFAARTDPHGVRERRSAEADYDDRERPGPTPPP